MKGVRAVVHQSSSLSDSVKLVLSTRSPSVAVVADIAPMWITASSLRAPSHENRSSGGTASASCRFCRLRHLPSEPRTSQTAMSVRPASLRLATTFDPINPAPPVTNNIGPPAQRDALRRFSLPYRRMELVCLSPHAGATAVEQRGEQARCRALDSAARAG